MYLFIVIDNLPYMPLNRAKMVVARPKPMLIRTDLCREFEKDLLTRLALYPKQNLPHDEYIKITYNLYCPSEDYFTKEGKISSRCPDADSIKVLQDTLFKHLGLDDKHIKELIVKVRPSATGNWDYEIEIESYKVNNLYV